MVVFYSSIVGQPRVGISYSKQYGYILEQIRTILSMNSVYDMVVSFLRHCEVESQTEMATYVIFTVHSDADTNRHRHRGYIRTIYGTHHRRTPTDTDTDV